MIASDQRGQPKMEPQGEEARPRILPFREATGKAVPSIRIVEHVTICGIPVALLTEGWPERNDCPCRGHFDPASGLWYTQRAVNQTSGEIYAPAGSGSGSGETPLAY